MIQILAITLGLIMGSFLSMLIPRLHNGDKGIISGRSKCPFCKKILGALELIPLFSFIFQKGECKECKKKIPFWYPAIEITMAAGFLGITYYFGTFMEMGIWAALYWIFLYIFFYDLRYKEIHDVVLIPGIIFALGASFFIGDPISSLIGAAIAILFFGVQFVVSRGKWLGSGDIFIGAFMGLVLGWELTLVAIFISYILGSVIGVGLMIFNKAKGETAVPLGPFLVLGSMIAFLYGDQLIQLYLGL